MMENKNRYQENINYEKQVATNSKYYWFKEMQSG